MRRAVAIATGVLLLAATVGAFAIARGDAVQAPTLEPGPTGVPSSSGPSLTLPSAPQAVEPPPVDPVVDEVREALETRYYRAVPEDVLKRPTIEGMLEALDDPYTDYLEPEEYERLRGELEQSYYGVGLRVGPGEGGLIVTSSLGGPAREAGIRPGDVIVSIDGRPATRLPFDRSAALIKGAEGTIVRLGVRRPGQKRPIEFVVVRREIDYPAVRSRLMRTAKHLIGYVRVLSFREDVGSLVAGAVGRLADRGAEAYILDLRGDPGGLLSQAVEISSVFLDEGVVCSTAGANSSRSYFVSGKAVDTERPLVVLVDGATASAAEIVAGALADNERAILVGSRTYGKATVQTLVELSNGAALKLTSATYLTPSGKSIAGRGIRPSVKAVDDPLSRPDEAIVEAGRILVERI